MSEEERKIKDVENRECGCVVTHYEDGGQLFAPCVPHGLIGVSQALAQAANAMGAVASVLQREQAQAMQRANIAGAINKAQSDADALDDEEATIIPGPGAEDSGGK